MGSTKVEAVGMTCSPHWRWNGVGFGRWVKQYLESIHRYSLIGYICVHLSHQYLNLEL
jgi:hypothetical protein